MKPKVALYWLTCLITTASVYVISSRLGDNYMASAYARYPEMKTLNMVFSIVISILAFIFVYSYLQSFAFQDNTSHQYTKFITWVPVGIILVASMIIGLSGSSLIINKITENWEKIKVAPLPYVNYDFARLFDANVMTGCENCDHIHTGVTTIDGDRKSVLSMHPDSEISFDVILPPKSELTFSISLAPEVWQVGMGDGVEFKLCVDDGRDVKILFRQYIDPKNVKDQRVWLDYVVDLSPWGGQPVTLIFSTTPGPNGDDRFDWAVWGEPRLIQPVHYNFIENLPQARVEAPDDKYGQVQATTLTINNELRELLSQHPSSRVIYSLTLPESSTLIFGFGMAEEVWLPENGDGVEYSIYVKDLDSPFVIYQVFHKFIDPKNTPDDRHWFDEQVNLNRFGGQEVEIIFEVLPGPAGNLNFDWGGWSLPVLIDDSRDMSVENSPIQ